MHPSFLYRPLHVKAVSDGDEGVAQQSTARALSSQAEPDSFSSVHAGATTTIGSTSTSSSSAFSSSVSEAEQPVALDMCCMSGCVNCVAAAHLLDSLNIAFPPDTLTVDSSTETINTTPNEPLPPTMTTKIDHNGDAEHDGHNG